jgi:beta-glucanase (GH16 family)
MRPLSTEVVVWLFCAVFCGCHTPAGPRRPTDASQAGMDAAVSPEADAVVLPDLTTGGDLRGEVPPPVELDGSVRPGWRLIWSDEFDGPAGAAPDPARWKFDVGGDGWGNAELQHYTDRRENSALDGQGHLAITARREDFGGRSYTSARLNSSGRFTQAYGRFEARIQVPTGRGIWPAFWMLGQDIGQVGWPTCGEIDIMEQAGSRPSENLGSLHGPGYSGGSAITSRYRLPNAAVFSSDFHLFAVEWEEGVVRFYVDEMLYGTRTPADLPSGARWVFDHPFFIIVNLAVGGRFPGNPDQTTTFPQSVLIDHVRVYAR